MTTAGRLLLTLYPRPTFPEQTPWAWQSSDHSPLPIRTVHKPSRTKARGAPPPAGRCLLQGSLQAPAGDVRAAPGRPAASMSNEMRHEWSLSAGRALHSPGPLQGQGTHSGAWECRPPQKTPGKCTLLGRQGKGQGSPQKKSQRSRCPSHYDPKCT